MNTKKKFGVEHLYFYKLTSDYGASMAPREMIVCCLENCDNKTTFSSKTKEFTWNSGIPDDNELESIFKNLGSYDSNKGFTTQIYLIDTQKSYKDIEELKKDTLILKISGIK